jgi:eukaryotic-like serine/threonine-protein kinase
MTNSEAHTGDFDPLDRIIADYLQALEAGKAPSRQELLQLHPTLAPRLQAFFADFDAVGKDASKFRLPDPQATVGVEPNTYSSLPKIRYLGDYELVEEIARGGMGVVYKARQVSLNRVVAIKMILAGTYATEQAVQRFRAEAEAAANLDHPNILPIYEVGEHEGHQYFSMKLVEGGSLSAKIDELKSQPRQIASLMSTLARAVHFAHQRGILHRDLKPANILLDADGTPFITDFGLAKKVDADDGRTRTGSIVGTPSYMAPEQARGEKGLTTAVDVYSLGAILYEMLTGEPPFKAETVFGTVKLVLEAEAKTPVADRDLATIAMKCLSKAPSKRFGTASELAEDLGRYLRGEAITARPVGKAERFNKWVRRNKAITVLALSLYLAMCFGIIMSIKFAGEADRRAIAAEASEAILKIERDETAKVSATLKVTEQLAQARLYGSQIRLAQSAQVQNQIGQAKRALAEIGPEYRGWEYYHLLASTDMSKRSVRVGNINNHLALSPDGKVLGFGSFTDRFCSLKLAKDARERDNFHTSIRGHSGYHVDYSHDYPSLLYTEDQRGIYYFAADGLKYNRFGEQEAKVFGHAMLEVHKQEGKAFMAALAFSPDKKRVYSAGRGKLTCWNREDLKEAWAVDISQKDCWKLAVSPDDNLFALWVLDDKRELKIYNRKEQKWVFTVGPYDAPFFLQFARDGKKLFAHRNFGEFEIWDVAAQKVLTPWNKERGSSVAIDAKGTLAIKGLSNGDVVFYDVENLKELERFRAHSETVEYVAIAPDGMIAATASRDKTVQLWDVPNRKRLRVLTGHTDSVHRLHFTPDSKTLISGGFDGNVRWWALDHTGPAVQLPMPDGKELRAWQWFKDSERMVLARSGWEQADGMNGQSSKIEVWNTVTGKREREIGKQGRVIHAMALSADEHWLVTGSNDHTVKLWDMTTGKEVRTQFEPYAGKTEPWQEANIKSVAFTPDGSRYIIGKGDGTVQLFDRATGNEIWAKKAVMPELWTTFYNGKQRMGEPIAVYGIQYTADGKNLILQVGGWGRGIFLWDASTGKTRYESKDLSPAHIEFPWLVSPDHKTIYFAGERNDGILFAVDIESGTLLFQQSGFPSAEAMAISRDGKMLAVGGIEKDQGQGERGYMIQLFDVDTKTVTAKLKGHEEKVSALAFVADPVLGNARQRLFSGSHDHTVKIWNPENGQELLSLPLSERKGSSRVEHLLVASNGTSIAATDGMPDVGTGGNVVRVWTGSEPKRLPAMTEDDSDLTAVERDMKRISQSAWVCTDTTAAWSQLSDKEKELAGEKQWTKIMLDVEPHILYAKDDPLDTHVITPKHFKPSNNEPSSITLYGGGIEENGKRYLRITNRDEKEYRIEFELKDNKLRMKGKIYWIEPGQGIISAPWVFDGEYTPIRRP